jgi:hypothetical protein
MVCIHNIYNPVARCIGVAAVDTRGLLLVHVREIISSEGETRQGMCTNAKPKIVFKFPD